MCCLEDAELSLTGAEGTAGHLVSWLAEPWGLWRVAAAFRAEQPSEPGRSGEVLPLTGLSASCSFLATPALFLPGGCGA